MENAWRFVKKIWGYSDKKHKEKLSLCNAEKITRFKMLDLIITLALF